MNVLMPRFRDLPDVRIASTSTDIGVNSHRRRQFLLYRTRDGMMSHILSGLSTWHLAGPGLGSQKGQDVNAGQLHCSIALISRQPVPIKVRARSTPPQIA